LTVSIFLIVAFFLIFYGLKIQKSTKVERELNQIPKGKITYTDLKHPGKILFSKRYRISGKPDYIIRDNNYYIPVEVKSTEFDKPQKNHILQLASYCHLVEENYHNYSPYGIIVYKNSNFKIPFNPKLRYELELIIHRMKKDLKSKNLVPNHNEPRKCLHCLMRFYCNNKLA
jgi:CRISPR-associated exonuclease Cas4